MSSSFFYYILSFSNIVNENVPLRERKGAVRNGSSSGSIQPSRFMIIIKDHYQQLVGHTSSFEPIKNRNKQSRRFSYTITLSNKLQKFTTQRYNSLNDHRNKTWFDQWWNKIMLSHTCILLLMTEINKIASWFTWSMAMSMMMETVIPLCDMVL